MHSLFIDYLIHEGCCKKKDVPVEDKKDKGVYIAGTLTHLLLYLLYIAIVCIS